MTGARLLVVSFTRITSNSNFVSRTFRFGRSCALLEKTMSESSVKKVAKWTVVVIFLLNWVSWMIVIHRHWDTLRDGAQPSAVILLVLLPFPCILMFRGREESLSVAFLAYVLLFFAIRVVCR